MTAIRIPTLAMAVLLVHAPVVAQNAPMDRLRQSEKASLAESVMRAAALREDVRYDVEFYHLTLDLGLVRREISGSVLVRFRSQVDALDEIRLDLRRELTVDSVSGAAAGAMATVDTLTVRLDRPLSAGEHSEVRVHYHGSPPLINSRKGLVWSYHGIMERVITSLSTPFLAHTWWPCKDGPSDKADSVWLDITIPDTTISGNRMVVTSNGLLEGTTDVGSKTVYHWRHRYPIVPFYVMVAVSNYDVINDAYIGERVSFPLNYYVFREDRDAAEAGVAGVGEAIDLFSELFGDYPFAREGFAMTQLDGSFFGAIENQTNVVTDSLSPGWFRVTVHELAHQWFGNMITCRDWRHAWLNEGFATYCEALWAEHKDGPSGYQLAMMRYLWLDKGTLLLPPTTDPTQVFLSIVYDKGAWVLHMLRGVVGDATFAQIMRQYAADTTLRYGLAVSEDFQRVCELVSGIDLDYFFDQWLLDEGYPEYRFSSTLGSTTASIRIEQRQSEPESRWVFSMPLRVRLTFQGGGDTTVVLWNDQRIQDYQVTVARPVVRADLDPERWVLRTVQNISGVAVDDGTRESVSLEVVPNPIDATASLHIALPAPSSVDVAVFDVRGSCVAMLASGLTMSAGNHELIWRPEADGAASGVYTIRVVTAAGVVAQRVVVVPSR